MADHLKFLYWSRLLAPSLLACDQTLLVVKCVSEAVALRLPNVCVIYIANYAD